MYFVDPQICDGRLTASSGVPVPTSDISDGASIYFTPYKGSRIALYVQDYGWRLYEFSELQLVVAPMTASKVHDILNAGL